MSSHRLPNGKSTSDEKVYVKAWRNLAKPLCKKMGVKLAGYDPHIVISMGEGTSEISLPVKFVEKFNKVIENLSKNEIS